MKDIKIKPRYTRIDNVLQKEDIMPLGKESFTIALIPIPILKIIGAMKGYKFFNEGRCNLVVLIECRDKNYVLKISTGEFRGEELSIEDEIVKEIKNIDSLIPIAKSYGIHKDGNIYFQLQEYLKGKSLKSVLIETDEEGYRFHIFREMGKELRRIHDITNNSVGFIDWLDGQLSTAEVNLKNGVLDLVEFEGIDSPENVLKYLIANRPMEGKVSLLHGDYRPKNILWKDNKVSGIIDWGFCDVGDPYYDLAIISYYFKNDMEKKAFFEGYGLGEDYSQERIKYFDLLSKFINI